MASSMTIKDIAEELHMEPSKVRRKLRTIYPDQHPGGGNRWSIERDEFRRIKEQFTSANATHDQEPTSPALNGVTQRLIENLRQDLDELEARLTSG